MEALFHFSEDPSIERFTPHVPATNPTKTPAVWAIDAAHAPLYWFPRNCPRVTAWPRTENERLVFESAFHTTAPSLHAFELGWLERVQMARLFRYQFDALSFSPSDASGQWISGEPVEPVAVEPVGDLIDAHVTAGIELRVVPSLWPLHDAVQTDRWDFSIVRLRNAARRP